MTELLDRLAVRRITRVVSIDDENAIPRMDDPEIFARELARVAPRKVAHVGKIVPSFAVIAELRNEISGDDTDDRAAAIQRLLEREIHKGGISSDDIRKAAAELFHGHIGKTAATLKKLFPGLAFDAESFESWSNNCERVIAEADDENRILLLVDEINDHEPGIDLNGVQVLADLWTRFPKERAFVDSIIVTSNCNSQEEFSEAQHMLARIRTHINEESLTYGVTRAYVLSKERLAGDVDTGSLNRSMIAHINRVVATDLRGQLIDLTGGVLKKALLESLEWLEQIPIAEFQGSVFISSQFEGAGELDTLLRLTSLKQRFGIDEKLKSDGALRSKIAELRTFALSHIDAEHVDAAQGQLGALRALEFERPGEQLNSLLTPLSCGDVFEFDLEERGQKVLAILLANPCDLVLRSTGKRKSRRGWLVKLQKAPASDVGLLIGNDDRGYVLKTGSRPADLCYVFNNSTVDAIDLDVLDLCWTNREGRAELAPSRIGDSFEFVLPSQAARLRALSAQLTENPKTVDLWEHMLSPIVADVGEVEIGNLRLSKELSYGVRRVWRLMPEFAAAVLASCMSTVSRPAFGHDYLKQG